MKSVKANVSFGSIVATIGSILIGLGVAWMLALNWDAIPSALKIVLLVIATGSAYGTGVFARIKNYHKIGHSFLFLGAILYTLSIFLIAQIFSTSPTFQGTAILLLLSWVGILFTAYIFDSSLNLVLALVQFLIWIALQYIALFEDRLQNIIEPGLGILALIYLAIAILLYGLTQYHKSKNHEFFDVYRFWTALYILLLTYILSFQSLLPIIWPTGFSLDAVALMFMIGIFLVSIIAALVGISMSLNKKTLTGKEVFGFVVTVIIYILLITLASLVSGARVGFSRGISPLLLILWLVNNIVFIMVILAVIGYGVHYKSSKIVNLAISFFVLNIITRYIGFIIDLGGQMGFAVLSIIGGVILLFGGWAIEQWREKLIKKTESAGQVGFALN